MLSSPHRAGAALETYKELDRFSRARLRCAGELLIGAAVAGRVLTLENSYSRASDIHPHHAAPLRDQVGASFELNHEPS